jgi:peptide deformylase
MEERTIITVPADVLIQPTREIETINESHISLVEDMKRLMHLYKGVGLAANQVGKSESIIIVDISNSSDQKQSYPPFILINPKIISVLSDNVIMEEGCLSVPRLFLRIPRPSEVLVRGIDLTGKEIEIEAKDLLARVLLHEIDHLLGYSIFDYLSKEQQIEYLEFISSKSP